MKKKQEETVLAWHFLTADIWGNPVLRDRRQPPPDGVALVHSGWVAICNSGLHASKKLADAITYAPSWVLCRVKCNDIHTEHHDKFVCTRRTILKRADVSSLVKIFVRNAIKQEAGEVLSRCGYTIGGTFHGVLKKLAKDPTDRDMCFVVSHFPQRHYILRKLCLLYRTDMNPREVRDWMSEERRRGLASYLSKRFSKAPKVK